MGWDGAGRIVLYAQYYYYVQCMPLRGHGKNARRARLGSQAAGVVEPAPGKKQTEPGFHVSLVRRRVVTHPRPE